MKHNIKTLLLCLLLAAGTAAIAAFPLEALAEWGAWLRTLSLSGGGGNAAAWGIVLAVTALPGLGLLWRGRSKWDWLLLLAACEIFFGLFFLVNPTLLSTQADPETVRRLWSLASGGSAAATLLAWAVQRGLGCLPAAEHLGRTLERLLYGSAVLLGWLAVWSAGADLLAKIRTVAEGNTAPGLVLWPTNLILCLLAAAELIPALLGCAVLLWGGKLARAMEADPFREETVSLAETLSRRCGQAAAASVLICMSGNLLQMLLFPVLRSTDFSVSFPVLTILLAAALGLLCRYFRRAKAVSDDNETII